MQIAEGFQWSSAPDREEHFFKISTSNTWDKSEISIRGVSLSSHKPWGKYSIRKRGGEVMLNLFSSTESRGECRKAFFCFLCSVTLRGQPHPSALVMYGAPVVSVAMSTIQTHCYVGNTWLMTANVHLDFKKQVLYQKAHFWHATCSQNEGFLHRDSFFLSKEFLVCLFIEERHYSTLLQHFRFHNCIFRIWLRWCQFSTCHWDRIMRVKSWAEMNRFSLSISPHKGKKQQFLWKPLKWATFMAVDSKEEDEARWSSVETPLCLAGLGEFPFLSAFCFSSHFSFTLLLPVQIFKHLTAAISQSVHTFSFTLLYPNLRL